MYLRRYHDITISPSGVWNILRRLGMSRLPSSQRYMTRPSPGSGGGDVSEGFMSGRPRSTRDTERAMSQEAVDEHPQVNLTSGHSST